MKKINNIFYVTAHHIYCSFFNPKIWAAVILILMTVYLVISPYAKIANDFSATVSIGIVSYVFSDPFSVTVLFASMLFIFSDLPFNSPHQIFLITRSGKRAWCISQLIYIIFVSLFVLFAVISFTMVLLAGHISFDNSWGRVINTAVQSSELRAEYQIYDRVVHTAINTFSPQQALIWCLPVGTFMIAVFGSMIFALNMISYRIGGTIIGAFFLAFHLLTGYFLNWTFKWFSPLEWMSINVININHISQMPTPEYSICVLSGIYILSVTIVIFCSRKKVTFFGKGELI